MDSLNHSTEGFGLKLGKSGNNPRGKILHILTGKEKGGINNVLTSLTAEAGCSSWEIVFLLIGKGDIPIPREVRCERYPRRYTLDIASFLKVLRFVEKESVGIIHTHSVIANLYAFLIRRLRRTVRHVIHVHANLSQELSSSLRSNFKRTLLLAGNKVALKSCDKVITNSLEVKRYVIGLGVKSEKISVVYNGVDAKKIRVLAEENPKWSLKEEGRFIVGTAGRLMPIKNYSFFLKAAQEVLKEEKDVRFMIIGEGPEKENLQRLCSELGISGNVTFAGWLTNPYPLISKMDIFVLTSHWEGLGIVLLEAMSLEKPVVATNVGGIPEVVRDGENGILVTSDDVKALSRAIAGLLKNPGLRETMGRTGREIVETKFTRDGMVRGLEEVYHSLS